ncbi:MAG TPA: FAD-dependent oxidoreductase [Burkholderiaceae bacterium]|nr:FAD-dependent oxidoreductase [Burkholderiaceae bacterium]
MKVAIVGSGISGLAAAHALKGKVDVTLFESGDYFGGHTHTVDVTLHTSIGPVTHGVDTGFLVFNERTYPHFISLMAELNVATVKSDMSFSVQAPDPASPAANMEWSGTNLDSVFAQKRNLLNPRFWRMLRDLLRFNKLTTQLATQGNDDELTMPLGDFLRTHHFSTEFCDWYFLPMMACIWSCPTEQMLQFPTNTMVRFCHNHGLLQISNRPQWWTIAGGARNYVNQIIQGIDDKRLNSPVLKIETVNAGDGSGQPSGVGIHTQTGIEWFDKVVLATHSDQALKILTAPSQEQKAVLSAIPYQHNTAVLHTDTSVLPQNPKAWAAWNYERANVKGREGQQVCLHYLLNKLQPLPWQQAVIVSLNPVRAIDPQKVLQTIDYSHPVFDLHAVAAQKRMTQLQGQNNCYFAGAWMGYGFHEDGLKAGLSASVKLLSDAGLLGADR